jgi:hypothetical protein
MHKKLDTREFIRRAREVHGDKFDYSKANYTTAHARVELTCPTHGAFTQKAYSHLSGKGCRKCAGLEKHTLLSFVQAAQQVHGDKYAYHLADYAGNKTKLTIFCKEHGPFEQVPNSHLSGRGCVKCAKTAYQTDKKGYVYFLLSFCGKFMKVGITNKPKQRFSELRSKTPFMFTVIASYLMEGVQAPQIEKKAHKLMQSAGLKGFSGSTEWFRHDYDQEYAAHKLATAAGVEV